MEQNKMTDNKTYVYDASEIFEDIKDDPNNVLMNIPEEISEKMGWKPGDLLKIRVYEDSKQLEISKVEPTENNNE
jgi:hypothetical protein